MAAEIRFYKKKAGQAIANKLGIEIKAAIAHLQRNFGKGAYAHISQPVVAKEK